MKRGVRFVALFLAILMIIGALASTFAMAKGQDLDKDIYAYGAGLNDKAVSETAKLLKIEDLSQVKKIKVDSNDLYNYLGDRDGDESMISSIYAMKAKKGTGVEIIITTPGNITQVTGAEYTNAALTAGVTDVKIHIGAVRPVTGTSALTGVYKAFEAYGKDLDKDRVDAANEELEVVNAIVQEHKDDSSFSTEGMNNVIIYVKEALIQFKEDNKEAASPEKVEQIINEALEKYDLKNVVNQVNIENLNVYFQNFQNTTAIDSKELKGQLETFSKDFQEKSKDFINGAKEGISKGSGDLLEGAGKALDKAKDYANSEEGKSFFKSVGQFLGKLFTSIGEFFTNLFN